MFPLGGTPFSVSGLVCSITEGQIWFLDTLAFTVVVIEIRGISGVTIYGIRQMDNLKYSCPRYASKLGYRGVPVRYGKFPAAY